MRLRKTLTSRAWTPARDHRRSSAGAGAVAGAGGLDDLADLVPPRVRHPSAAETAPVVLANVSAPSSPTNAGRPTWRCQIFCVSSGYLFERRHCCEYDRERGACRAARAAKGVG